jgi:iron complex transport system ATP-binding protein
MNMLTTRRLQVRIADKAVCRDLQLQVEPGQVWGILGRNGIGKTTLLHTLAGLREADAGDILLQQQDIRQLGRKQLAQKLGLLLQHHEDAFPVSVLDTVLGGRHPHIDLWHWETADDHAIARRALQAVNMLDMAQRQVDRLSGGERQRVAIATLLTQDPQLYLLDEPNSHLDLNYQISLLQILTDHARQQQRSIIMSLHDINLAARFCSHILYLYGDGETETGGSVEQLQPARLQKVFEHPINSATQNDGRNVFWPD